MRLRHAKAHPCFTPVTKPGIAPGSITWRKSAKPERPMERPARTSKGGKRSKLSSSETAMDGAAPSTTTDRIARSLSWKSRMASGNQVTEGTVCRPESNGPTAARRSLKRPSSSPSAPPTAMEMPRPMAARPSVTWHACHTSPSSRDLPRRWSTGAGPGRSQSGQISSQTTKDHTAPKASTESSGASV